MTAKRYELSDEQRLSLIGDSQVRADDVNVAALELIGETGNVGLGFIQTLFHPLPDQTEIEAHEAWPAIAGQEAIGLVHRVSRPRGGNQRTFSLPFHEALQVALWDLAAKEVVFRPPPLPRVRAATA